EEALDRVRELAGLRRDLDVRDTLDVERDAALRVGALHAQVDDHVGERDAIDRLDHRATHRAAALHQAVAEAAPGLVGGALAAEDEDLVRRTDVGQPRDRGDDHQQREAEHDEQDDDGSHWAPPLMTLATSMPSVSAISLNSAPTVAG